MKTLFIFLFSFSVFISSSQAQWSYISIPNNFRVESADAIGNNFAVIATSSNTLLITTDVGATWTTKNLPADAKGATDISIINTSVFYVAAGNGSFYKSIDGGNTWTTIFSNPDLCSFGDYIEMFSESKGIAMGDGPNSSAQPVFLKTTNGNEWLQTCFQPIGRSGDTWRRLDFIDENVGYFYGSFNSPNRIHKTTDGGTSWTTLNHSFSVQVLKFFDADYGLAYMNGTFYKTTNGGTSWVVSGTIDSPDWGMDIEFVPGDKNKIWFSNYSNIFYSSDGGSTWLKQTAITHRQPFREIVFTSQNVGWIFLDSGNIYYTNNNGGFLTSTDEHASLPSKLELFQNYPNPFNPATKISYSLPKAAFVTMKVYNPLGKEIAELVNEHKSAGTFEVEFSAANFASGIYFYRLSAGDFSFVRKMVVLK